MENQSVIRSSRFKERRDILESTPRLLREIGKGKEPFAHSFVDEGGGKTDHDRYDIMKLLLFAIF